MFSRPIKCVNFQVIIYSCPMIIQLPNILQLLNCSVQWFFCYAATVQKLFLLLEMSTFLVLLSPRTVICWSLYMKVTLFLFIYFLCEWFSFVCFLELNDIYYAQEEFSKILPTNEFIFAPWGFLIINNIICVLKFQS